MEAGLIDDAIHIPDEYSIRMVYRMLDEEGIYLGASSALNVAAAVEMAKALGRGSRVVTILCDGAGEPSFTTPPFAASPNHPLASQVPIAIILAIVAREQRLVRCGAGAPPVLCVLAMTYMRTTCGLLLPSEDV